jgi:hypothetical protein
MLSNWGRLPMALFKGIIAVLVAPIGYIMIKTVIDSLPADIIAFLQGYQVAMLTSLIPIVFILAALLWVFSDFIFPPAPPV